MPRNNLEDATAKALDLLPHDDAARSDPRLVRDAKCLEEIRAVQEVAADVWLAASPLCAAPPDVLSLLMSKVDARTPLARRHTRFFPWLAASGWVAAAITFLLWPRDGEKASPVATVDPPVFLSQQVRPEVAASPITPLLPPDRRVIPNDRRMREELLRAQAQVASLDERGAFDAPRVLGLHSPDALLPEPDEMQRRVVGALADALSSLLEMESGSAGDPARFVLKRGWVPEGLSLAEGEFIRHLNFPPNAVEEYGLLVSEDGAYFDEEREMIWFPDENGRGYLGRMMTADDNINAFYVPDEKTLAANSVALRTQPEGYVIEDPASNTAKVLIDQVPPPAAGFEQVVIWTDAEGNEGRLSVENPAVTSTEVKTNEVLAAADNRIPVLPSMSQEGTCRLFFSLPDINGVKSFSLVELPIAASSVAAAATNKVVPKVIVSGERRSRGSKLR
ncbi:hypothetical protein OKA05_10455 [Luteolibacter arcticus]|uniref:Uncharacterized protein n=1 Tax=Luteolibacter arcticus TaxID=1581411 RepID=A0ABT3GH88_9BACT|nr:hypothetical protein [Luteolibacter arcticus]MCW1922973.1 hypothetical protein [Luteolibacter arcticus]